LKSTPTVTETDLERHYSSLQSVKNKDAELKLSGFANGRNLLMLVTDTPLQ